jgi:hypothetical protein
MYRYLQKVISNGSVSISHRHGSALIRILLTWILGVELPVAPLGPLRKCLPRTVLHISILTPFSHPPLCGRNRVLSKRHTGFELRTSIFSILLFTTVPLPHPYPYQNVTGYGTQHCSLHYYVLHCRRSPQEDYSESESDWGEEDEGGGRTAAARRPPPRKQTKPKVIVQMRCTVVRSRVADPDSIRSMDPDSDSGSGSRKAKMTHKSRKTFLSCCFEVLDGLF